MHNAANDSSNQFVGVNIAKFQRVIPYRARIQNTAVTAEYKDGILNLTLPKSEAEKTKVVKVNLGENAA